MIFLIICRFTPVFAGENVTENGLEFSGQIRCAGDAATEFAVCESRTLADGAVSRHHFTSIQVPTKTFRGVILYLFLMIINSAVPRFTSSMCREISCSVKSAHACLSSGVISEKLTVGLFIVWNQPPCRLLPTGRMAGFPIPPSETVCPLPQIGSRCRGLSCKSRQESPRIQSGHRP